MHRLHDEHGNVAPCPCCGKHHFGPRDQIEDSTVDVYYSDTPTLWELFKRISCMRRGHDWGTIEDYQMGHIQRCTRCDATRMTVPVIVVGEVGELYSLHGRDRPFVTLGFTHRETRFGQETKP